MSPKKRPKLTGDTLDDFFQPTTEPKSSPPPYDRKYARHTYRVMERTHAKIKDIAHQEGVGLNDLVRYILQTFVDRYERGEIELPVEEYVVTHSRLTE